MNVFEAVLLGVVQGLAEFLPISSSGHLQLMMQLFSMQIDENAMMLVTVLLHVGTLAVVLIVFWKDWLDILKNPLRSRLLLYLFIASLPALIIKLALGDFFDDLNAGGMLGVFFLVTAVMMVLVENLSRGRHIARREKPTARDAVIMGCFQGLGMMTGISRSGSTTLGGIFSGLSRKGAVHFCFLMSAPAIVGGLIVEGRDAYKAGAFSKLGEMALPIALGMLAAFVTGLLAVRFMLKKVNKISFHWFALYMGILGVATIIMQVMGVGGLLPVGLSAPH